jgi:hypothetical protein
MVSQSGKRKNKRKNKRNKPASQTDAASIKKTSKSEIFSQTFGFAGFFVVVHAISQFILLIDRS